MAKCKLNWSLHSAVCPAQFCCNNELTLAVNEDGQLFAVPGFSEGLPAVFPDSVAGRKIVTVANVQGSWFVVSYDSGSLLLIDITPHSVSVLHSLELAAPMRHILFSHNRIFLADESTLYLTDCEFSYCFSIFSSDRIVQLSPFGLQDVLVSTMSKSYIIKDKGVTPIGRKERNGQFGACQIEDSIYASRPNGNIWEATAEGVVKATVNYKTVQGHKVKFGLLFAWTDQFLASVSDDSLVIIDVQQNSVFYKEEGVQVYFNLSEQKLYVRKEAVYLADLQTSRDIFNSLLDQDLLDRAVAFALEDPAVQKLEFLDSLCQRVFVEGAVVQNHEAFVQLIDRLEACEDLELPVAEFESGTKADPDFELFDIKPKLRSTQVVAQAQRKQLVQMSWALKRARFLRPAKARDFELIVEYFSRTTYTYMHIRNLLLDLIWRRSAELVQIIRFKRVAQESLDLASYRDLSVQEASLLKAIEQIL